MKFNRRLSLEALQGVREGCVSFYDKFTPELLSFSLGITSLPVGERGVDLGLS